MAPKKPPQTRAMGSKNLRDILSAFQQDPNDPDNIKLREMTKEVQQQVKDSYTYDYASTSTQNRRNLHLEEFTSIIKASVKVNETNGAEHEDWEERLWGKDFIADNLRAYVLMVSQMIQPRAYKSQSIKFNTLAARRQSMMYWVIQKCDANVVSIKDVYNGSNRALYMAFRSNNLSIHAPPKLYANKDDIRNLIEYVTYSEPNVEMGQQMVIAWLDGFICGVRPGSISASRNRPTHYLRWEDIEISRLADGNFKLLITHKWLKGFNDEKMRPLRFSVAGPRFVEDVLFSLPHRLVALALRRGILANYKTVDDVMDDTRTKITFKQSALKQPVILASSAKGLALQQGKAALAGGLTTYLQRIAYDFGLPPNVTMYIWRRSAATAVDNAMGSEKARDFLAHNMDSNVYKGSYAEGTMAMDVMSVAMGRRIQTSAEMGEDNTLSVNRVKEVTNNKARWTKKYIAEHPEYIKHNQALQAAELAINDDGGTQRFLEASNMLDKIRRNLKNQAAIAFQEVELALVKEKMTMAELDKRRKNAKALGTFEAQLKAAADNARTAAEDEFGARAQTLRDDDAEDFGERAEQMSEDEDEVDAARQLEDNATIQLNGMSGDRAGDRDGDDATATELTDDMKATAESKAVFASSRMLVDLLVNQEAQDPAEEVECSACVVDETVPDTLDPEFAKDPKNRQKSQFKEKTYKRADLARHLAGDFHSAKNKWYRSFEDNNTEYQCPYGGEDSDDEDDDDDDDDGAGKEPACDFSGKPKDILKHCLRNKNLSDAHLLKAAKAGIYARDFDPTETRKIGKVVAKSTSEGGKKKKEGYAFKEFGDPDSFDVTAFVPPANIDSDGEVQENDDAAKYSGKVRLPPNADLVESTLYQEYPENVYGRVPDVLQQQRNFLARRADAILRQHGAEQTEKGETQSRATSGKGKRKLEALALNRQRLTDLGFDWVASPEDEDEEGEPAEPEEAEADPPEEDLYD